MLHASASNTRMRPAGDRMPMRAGAPQATVTDGDFDDAAREQSPIVAGNQALLRAPALAPSPAMLRPSRMPVLQRKCACGGAGGGFGQCAACREKKENAPHRQTVGAGASPLPPPP